LYAGGFDGSIQVNVIQYVTIASTGNATDFGDLIAGISGFAACSNATRGVFGGSTGSNVIQYVTIATTGNAIDFGDLTAARANLASCSNSSGGVQ
jgi:hypothetical protein